MKRIVSGLCLLLSFLFIACDQEPLFWDISQEYPPIEPIIKGAPSRIVTVEYTDSNAPTGKATVLYVTNGTVWEWDTSTSSNPNWRKMTTQPGGKIKTLAAADEYLFSLDNNGNIRRFDGLEWLSISKPAGTPEQLFGAGKYLFVGSLTGARGEKDGYSIFAMDVTSDPPNMTSIKSGTGLLAGAAENGGMYYLGIRGEGILSTSNPTSSLEDSTAVPGTETFSIIGLIEHGGIVVAVTTGRQILYSSGGSFASLGASTTFYFSGAMASWKNSDGDLLLLLGLQRTSGSFGYGYRELMWKSGEAFDTNKRLYTPGEDRGSTNPYISSVQQGSQYTSAIGNHVVTALYAVPPSLANPADEGERPIVFASTQKNGLWSYRIRKEEAQWNGEDNSN